MRSFMVSTVAVLAISTMATSGSAEEAKIATSRPRLELAPTVRVVGFHRPTGQTGMYTGGALGLMVDVENTGNSLAENVVVKLASGNQILESTVSIPARSTKGVQLNDADGLSSSCSVNQYKISLSGQGTGDATRNAHITPSCTFTTKIEQTWNLWTPDHVEAEKAGNAYLYAPSLQNGGSCGSVPTLKVRIMNKSTLSSPSIIVQEKDWTTGQVKAQTSAAFPLGAGEDKEVLLTAVSNSGGEPPARMGLAIVDWTKSLKGHTSSGGIFVNTTRNCSLSVALD